MQLACYAHKQGYSGKTPVLCNSSWADMFSQRISSILAFIAAFYAAIFVTQDTLAQEKSIIIASTTSTKDSGLFDHLLPLFTMKTGIVVSVQAVGTGQAFDMARRCDADVVFAHNKSAGQTFVADGYGVKQYPVMYNDFVLIGPESDPAGIKGMKDVAKALKAIKDKSATFISRGDNSGTHMFELMLWNKDVGINIQQLDCPWYRSIERGCRLRSTWRVPPAATSSPIAALGFLSKTGA